MKKKELDQDEWDRQVTLRLYKEYGHVTWAHKISLRPAAIRLFDSTTHWGRWDHEVRTIWISRRLVREYSWFHVESILRHEMAHQYAFETYGGEARPHGEIFKHCCERLGVPAEFSKATVNLQETDLNWRKEKQGEESEKLLSKVQKLLALATSSNENEAFLAMSKVRELYAKYNIDEFFTQGSRKASSALVHATICHGKKRIEAHQDKICGILVGHFFIKVIFCSEYNSTHGESYKAMQFVGTRENVLMAEYVYHFLLRETEYLVRMLRRNTKGKRQGLGRVGLKSYRLGILQGFQEKLAEADRLFVKDVSAEDRVSRENASHVGDRVPIDRALALSKCDQNLEEYLSKVFPRLRSISGNGQRIDMDSYSSGKVAGGGITLRKGVTSAGGQSGRLLGSR